MTPGVNGESDCRTGQRLMRALLLGGMTFALGARAQNAPEPAATAAPSAATATTTSTASAAATTPTASTTGTAAATSTTPTAAASAPAAHAALPAAFDVNEFIVRGNTTLTSLEIEQAV
jgi:hypothetical protein